VKDRSRITDFVWIEKQALAGHFPTGALGRTAAPHKIPPQKATSVAAGRCTFGDEYHYLGLLVLCAAGLQRYYPQSTKQAGCISRSEKRSGEIENFLLSFGDT